MGSAKHFDGPGTREFPTARIPYVHIRRPDAPESRIRFEGNDSTAGIPHAYFPRQQSRNKDRSHHVRPNSSEGFVATRAASRKDSQPPRASDSPKVSDVPILDTGRLLLLHSVEITLLLCLLGR
ncbi:uncharacterized protein BP5553_07521 [Venustampulla echinocandica]|uniref:Uncharacterized protein n=1 Tax=Venustampulla echinocandica TaxID=2656787 RepID=A0A370TGS7_9HELO|nr:uncharacterized protein BP5553_07521 [Venustampulla echinocandica]RDL34393.1 hypothetical protein BP5553_07521 [Venustampulla echinocandica]